MVHYITVPRFHSYKTGNLDQTTIKALSRLGGIQFTQRFPFDRNNRVQEHRNSHETWKKNHINLKQLEHHSSPFLPLVICFPGCSSIKTRRPISGAAEEKREIRKMISCLSLQIASIIKALLNSPPLQKKKKKKACVCTFPPRENVVGFLPLHFDTFTSFAARWSGHQTQGASDHLFPPCFMTLEPPRRTRVKSVSSRWLGCSTQRCWGEWFLQQNLCHIAHKNIEDALVDDLWVSWLLFATYTSRCNELTIPSAVSLHPTVLWSHCPLSGEVSDYSAEDWGRLRRVRFLSH